ncbi:MAG TPA: hypothetical protein DCM71_05460 [Runella sp.]|nr:hypothetical protein [Runella sp.]
MVSSEQKQVWVSPPFPQWGLIQSIFPPSSVDYRPWTQDLKPTAQRYLLTAALLVSSEQKQVWVSPPLPQWGQLRQIFLLLSVDYRLWTVDLKLASSAQKQVWV